MRILLDDKSAWQPTREGKVHRRAGVDLSEAGELRYVLEPREWYCQRDSFLLERYHIKRSSWRGRTIPLSVTTPWDVGDSVVMGIALLMLEKSIESG